MRRDEGGAIAAFEAVLAGAIILSAVIFLALVQRPAPPSQGTGLDLEQAATDALQSLTLGSNDLQGSVRAILDGTNYGTDSPQKTGVQWLKDRVAALLPTGARYLVQLDNGYGQLALVSSETGVFSRPVGALGSSATISLDRTKWLLATGGTQLRPGEPLGFTVNGSTCTVTAPNNVVNAPDGTSWASKWAGSSVPTWAPFGAWTFGGTCTAATVKVVHAAYTTAYNPVYNVNLVVWTLG